MNARLLDSSRCLLQTVQVAKVLQNVAGKENLKLPAELAERIAIESHRNLRKAVLMLEACKVEK